MAVEIVEFGDFRFDTSRLELSYDGNRLAAPTKSLEALKALVEQPGELLTREFLLEAVWEGAFVEDANLTVAISALRRELANCDERETYIQTIPRKGYRFVAAVRPAVQVDDSAIILERHSVETLTLQQARPPRYRWILAASAAVVVIAAALGGTAAYRSRWSPTAAAWSSAESHGEQLLRQRQVCESVPYFRQAVSENASSAVGYAHLATSLAMCGDTKTDSETAVANALALDPNSSDALAADGFVKMFRHWDWTGAESSLRRAVAADPENAETHHWLATDLAIQHRTPEALGEIDRAIEIEPNSAIFRADAGQLLYLHDDPKYAIAQYRLAAEIQPDLVFLPMYMRDAYAALGDGPSAGKYELDKLRVEGGQPEALASYQKLLDDGGVDVLMNAIVTTDLAAAGRPGLTPDAEPSLDLVVAEDYSMLRDRENTIKWLERAVGSSSAGLRPFRLAYVGVEPRYAFVRDDPRFKQILDEMGLPHS